MPYAIEELRSFMAKVSHGDPYGDPNLRYVCALLAELAYLEVSQLEIDDHRRAKLVPSSAFQAIAAKGQESSAIAALGMGDKESEIAFVARTDAVVAVGFGDDDALYITMRGTKLLFDWGINLHAERIPLRDEDNPFVEATFHRGFLLEAARIRRRIDLALPGGPPSRIYFTGHSLGGAVAILSLLIAYRWRSAQAIVFAAPRCCSAEAYLPPYDLDPIQVRRMPDMVPTVPPKNRGYADYPNQYRTDGTPLLVSTASEMARSKARGWFDFAYDKAASHEMKAYRQEVGSAAGAQLADAELADFASIGPETIKRPVKSVGP